MQTQNTQRKCIMTRRTRGSHHLVYRGVWTKGWSLLLFPFLCSTSSLLFWRAALSAVVLLQLSTLRAKFLPAAKIITDRCLSPIPQPTVTVCTQTTVYAEMCSTWQRWLAAACTMPKVGAVGGGWDHKRSSVSVSQAPDGSPYCSDWLMYSDHPESTMLDGKRA